MSELANKPCYPSAISSECLTFRERLIVALASNTSQISLVQIDYNAIVMIAQADAIIKQLEEGKK